jgi:hypothetical protein
MPLPPPAERTLTHTRNIETHGYRRADGLWDIEGRLTDVKTFDKPAGDGARAVKAGTPVHEMWLRLTIDSDYLIHDVAAATDSAPFSLCATVPPDFTRLKGERMSRGFNRRVQQLVGGTVGCTHLRELVGRLANTAHQTMYEVRTKRDGPRDLASGQAILDTCRAYAADSPIVQERWPSLYTGPRSN